MNDNMLDKVINGLKVHLKPNSRCAGCPYPNNGLCGDQLYRDALALLEEQEPRLLGLDEIKMLGLMWLESRNGFVQPVICQNYEYGVDRSVEFIMVHGTICNSINTFGKLWRVWTSKPSDEQMEAAPWK